MATGNLSACLKSLGLEPHAPVQEYEKAASRCSLCRNGCTVRHTAPCGVYDFPRRQPFRHEHAYSKTLIRLGELVNKSAGKTIAFDLRGNSEPGIEPDCVNFLNQGVVIILVPMLQIILLPEIVLWLPKLLMPASFR